MQWIRRDRDARDHLARGTAHDDREASKLLGVDSGGLGYFVAAIRECFEEAGLLFAEDRAGLVSFADPPSVNGSAGIGGSSTPAPQPWTLSAGTKARARHVGRLRYFSHWITPVGAPRRYDTRFFVGIAPEGQPALHDDAEVVASEWVVPSEALERHRGGELDLLFPTVKHLESLARFESARELWSAPSTEVADRPAPDQRRWPALRILLPGDPGFEEATGLPEGMAFPDRPVGDAGA